MELSQKEKKELKDLAASRRLRQDMEIVSCNRHNPFCVEGRTDLDKLIDFLTTYNEFSNHILRPFSNIIERNMQL